MVQCVWGQDTRLTNDPAPSLTSNPNGRCVAADGAGWDDDHWLTVTEEGSAYPSLAGSPLGKVHLVWYDERDGNQEIYYRMGDPGELALIAWDEPEGVDASVICIMPNPSTGPTRIRFWPRYYGRTFLAVCDVAGRVVWTQSLNSPATGVQDIMWHGRGLSGRPVASGTYFVNIRSGRQSSSRKLVILR